MILLADEVLPEQPARQWVLCFSYPLRLLFANRPTIMGQLHRDVNCTIATHVVDGERPSREGYSKLDVC